jgi:glycosyltransferase involved in cell wall biosynthesis
MGARVKQTHPEARFVWVGKGELRADAEGEARRVGIPVTFAGFRPDVAKIAACFDVYVVSSLCAGLVRALTEAMASARPVVATAVNGVVDLVEPGFTGLLVAAADPDALAENVVWLLDHPVEARRMCQAVRTRVRELFQPRIMCSLIDQAYARRLGIPAGAVTPDRAR